MKRQLSQSSPLKSRWSPSDSTQAGHLVVQLTCPVCDRPEISGNVCPNCETDLSLVRMLVELAVPPRRVAVAWVVVAGGFGVMLGVLVGVLVGVQMGRGL